MPYFQIQSLWILRLKHIKFLEDTVQFTILFPCILRYPPWVVLIFACLSSKGTDHLLKRYICLSISERKRKIETSVMREPHRGSSQKPWHVPRFLGQCSITELCWLSGTNHLNVPYYLLKIFLYCLHRGRERDREQETSMREKYQSAAFCTSPHRGCAHSQGTCPQPGWNLGPLSLQVDALSIEPNRFRLHIIF